MSPPRPPAPPPRPPDPVRIPRTPPPRPHPRPMTEGQLQACVTRLCDHLRLLWYHPADSRRDRAGWPDLVIIGARGRVIFRELKSDDGRHSLKQLRTGRRLLALGHNWATWRPEQWHDGTILAELFELARGPA